MRIDFVPHICRECPIHHVDNCEDCFGFGFEKIGSKMVPLRASKVLEVLCGSRVITTSLSCPTCGSNHEGANDSFLEFLYAKCDQLA